MVHGISIEQNIAENMYLIHGDPTQLQQVFLNLFNNAIDAILERHGTSGGKLIIQAGPKEKNTVEILVRDNGCGIKPDNVNKIFSPFFTTKPVGKGAGLGLSVCYGIISSMLGTMEVDSKVNFGTTFTICLPAVV
jgi:two-component system NtrC family sensor kinase